MPDIRTFAEKHWETASNRGTGTAVANIVSEAGVWAYSRARERLRGPGRLIWADDWDICLVIDACRWDLFQDVAPEYSWMPSGRNSAWSVGSASPEWYGRTFAPGELPHDERIGCVTANPFAGKPADRIPEWLGDATPLDCHGLAIVDYVYEDSWGCTVDNGYLDVTHPAAVTNRAYDAWTTNDLDRLVVHYMQPHIPFRSRPEWFGERENLTVFGEADKEAGTDPWLRVRNGVLPAGEFWRAYADNLQWVLDDIDRLRAAVDAQLLVTSDHGNAMGEWGLWSHPPGMHVRALREVPWVTVQGRGGEWEEKSVQDSTPGERDIDEQLAALGYA